MPTNTTFCILDACNNYVAGANKYCTKHCDNLCACVVKFCKRICNAGENTCPYHATKINICLKKYCNQVRLENKVYCKDHYNGKFISAPCKYPGCANSCRRTSDFCELHVVRNCREPNCTVELSFKNGS